MLQSNGLYQRVLLGGDLNFRDLQWNKDGEMLIHMDLGRQQEELFMFCTRFLLSNWVDKPTRGKNLLDVVLGNDRDLLLRYDTILNCKFSDHNLVKLSLTVDTSGETKQTASLGYPSRIPLYN